MRCESPRYVFPDGKPEQLVGCGKCLACLSNKRSDWTFRLIQEYKRSRAAVFVTLTYHPKFYPDRGVSKRHLQLFMKRLRKSHGNHPIRYYAVAEYGTRHGRGHYHIILFNYKGDRRQIEKAWSLGSSPIGIVDVRPVNEARLNYTTKYVIQLGNHVDKTLNKPFCLMSRGYGLGGHYLTDEMIAWHRSGGKNYTMVYGQKGRLPRYYKNIIWPDKEVRAKIGNRSKWQAIKAHRKNMRDLKAQGYDPKKIMAEMRKAVYDRIKQKVAFTQKL